MISNTTAKFIKSLQLKKYRKKEQKFLVEGEKSVLEVIQSRFKVTMIMGTEDFIFRNRSLLTALEVIPTTSAKLQALGTFKTNDSALAVVEIQPEAKLSIPTNEFILALDGVNDPGNLGTIIRIADWYGFKNIIASRETADFYNPKVISSSKGSFTRIGLHYCDLLDTLKDLHIPIYGTFMDGENVHGISFKKNGVLVMGNEANGISKEVETLVSQKITIPKFGEAESLNVAMATAVICDNIRRPSI
ncbi:MAG TPA: RNA methyltransferase [Fulvivirga sp.]|nr:RNA methyltransferase [Fulvivirga sp.]